VERLGGQFTGTTPSGKRKRPGSGLGSEVEVEDRWSTGSIAGLGLIPPTSPPSKESKQLQVQQPRWKGKWKGKGKSATRKRKKKARIVSQGTSGEEAYAIVEGLAWKPVGPLKRRSQPADVDAESDLELEEPLIVRSRGRLVVEEPEQEGDFKIDLPDQLRHILALTPSQYNKQEDGEAIVRNLLTGRGEFLSRAEVWAAGEVAENNGDDDDDWDGEPGGWWEAEL